jgi:zinc D-Ala-D-Ala dipeptidase
VKLAFLVALTACAPAAAEATAPAGSAVVPQAAHQLITGVIADWSATRVTLRRWRRDGDGQAWTADGAPWQGVIGKGAAWGAGLHGTGAPSGRDGPTKHEGDGKSPAGVFALRGAYGYAAKPPAKAALPYTQVTADWQCVDDAASSHYTQILDRTRLAGEVDWKTAEAMRRRDALYTWVVDIAHNPAAHPGDGSCIFFHVWRNAASATVGCTAMPETKLTTLLAGLEPSAVYVLLPRAEYDAFTAPWGLPLLGK